MASIRRRSTSVLALAALLTLLALPAAAGTLGEAEEPVEAEATLTKSVDLTIDIEPVTRTMDATYVTPSATLDYDGSFYDAPDGTPQRFEAAVASVDAGTFAEGTFRDGSFWIRLGAVEIDSSSPITQEQADMIAAFAATDEAEQLRKMVRALQVETPPEDSHYLLGLAAMVMVIDSGAGAAQGQAADDCFGCCGPGCWGCTGCYTDACRAHDQCVKDHGHLDCLKGLIPAVISLIDECLLNRDWWLAAA